MDYAAIKKNEKPDVTLMPYDVIEVPEANAFSSQRIATTLLGAVTAGATGAISATGSSLPTRILY